MMFRTMMSWPVICDDGQLLVIRRFGVLAQR